MICCLCAMAVLSCTDKNSDPEEFVNWQDANDSYFAQTYQQATDSIKAGNTNWLILKAYSKDAAESSDVQDYIVVRRVASSTRTETPDYLDSVKVNYRGYLIPSASYSSVQHGKAVGKVIDTSWYGDDLNFTTAVPKAFQVSSGSLITGFVTALLHMHVGDRWLVIMPSKLAYWYKGSGTTIPAYSTLLFDLQLQSFKRR